jgi:ATP-binding cassette, subfamily B, bacterial
MRARCVRDARLETDHIMVLSDGVITEQGDHVALMALDGTYARLFGMQARGYVEQA